VFTVRYNNLFLKDIFLFEWKGNTGHRTFRIVSNDANLNIQIVKVNKCT